jgi:hypothetical protein
MFLSFPKLCQEDKLWIPNASLKVTKALADLRASNPLQTTYVRTAYGAGDKEGREFLTLLTYNLVSYCSCDDYFNAKYPDPRMVPRLAYLKNSRCRNACPSS